MSYLGRVSERWIEITDSEGTRRALLRDGLTRVGGGGEVGLAGTGDDQLHFWDEPLRVVFVGAGAPPVSGGATFEERSLSVGDAVQWNGATLRVVDGATEEAVLQEIAPVSPVPVAAVPQPPLAIPEEDPVIARVRAGPARRPGTQRSGGSSNAGRSRSSTGPSTRTCAPTRSRPRRVSSEVGDGRMRERAGRLLRDFLMASTMQGARGAGRRVRQATRGGVAFFLAQGFALLVYSLIVLVAMLLMRVKDFSFDELLDRFLLRN